MLYRILNWLAYTLGLDPRGIFVYWDGRRWRRGDPMRLTRALWSLPWFDSEKSRELIASKIGTSVCQGYQEISDAVRAVFGIEPIESSGLTEMECERLLSRFEMYLGDLKKNGSPGQTSPQFTVPDVSGITLTSPELDSGSILSDSVTA